MAAMTMHDAIIIGAGHNGLTCAYYLAKKGLKVFLQASDPAYDLVAVTDSPARNGKATTLPFMEPTRFHQLLGCVDAFVLPSVAEGFPISLQEALVAGLPVVTTSQPGYEHRAKDRAWTP